MQKALLLALLLVAALGAATMYPLIVMHGLGSSADEFAEMAGWIEKDYPGMPVYRVSIFNHAESVFNNLWKQSAGLADAIADIVQQNNITTPYNLLCFSQGGLLCRTFAQTSKTHRIHNFIGVSNPNMGQYGATNFDIFFPNITTQDAYKLFYTPLLQNHASVPNFWKDPFQYDMYVSQNIFLPKINCDGPNPCLAEYKSNFLRINKLILMGGPDDGVITPWQSALYGFFAINDTNSLVPMEQQPIYLNDVFGLKTLDKQDRLVRYVVPGIAHLKWKYNFTNYVSHIKPWLV